MADGIQIRQQLPAGFISQGTILCCITAPGDRPENKHNMLAKHSKSSQHVMPLFTTTAGLASSTHTARS